MNQKSISFDFDSTLSLQSVQDFAAFLISKGYDLWVITSRLPDGIDPKYKIHGMWVLIDNSDLFEVTDRLGIKREQIIFTSHQLKSEVINEMGLEFIFHLDDDWVELNHINRETNTIGISCFGTSGWKQKCKKLLNYE
jgi:hypothetical protein